MEEDLITFDLDLEELGFVNNRIETDDHVVHCVFYDGWHLSITGKPQHSPDSIYMIGYWTQEEFIELIRVITGKNLNE